MATWKQILIFLLNKQQKRQIFPCNCIQAFSVSMVLRKIQLIKYRKKRKKIPQDMLQFYYN